MGICLDGNDSSTHLFVFYLMEVFFMFNEIMLRDFLKNWRDELDLIIIDTTTKTLNIFVENIKNLKVTKYFMEIEIEELLKHQKIYIDIEKIENLRLVKK